MNQQEMEARVKEVFSDEEYLKELLDLETPEEVQLSLEGKGIVVSVNEIIQIREMLAKREEGELTDEELEGVAGGVINLIALTIIFWVGVAGSMMAIGLTDSYMKRHGKRW